MSASEQAMQSAITDAIAAMRTVPREFYNLTVKPLCDLAEREVANAQDWNRTPVLLSALRTVIAACKLLPVEYEPIVAVELLAALNALTAATAGYQPRIPCEERFRVLIDWAVAHAPLWFDQAVLFLDLLADYRAMVARCHELSKPKGESQ